MFSSYEDEFLHLQMRPPDSHLGRGSVFIPALCTAQALSLVPVVFIAVRAAADATRRITITKLAATYVVAALGPELRAVEGGKQSSAAHLPRDRGQCILRTGGTSGGVLRRVVHA